MKKYLILSSFLLLISSLSIIGYIVVDAKQEITLENNLLHDQRLQETYITPYGYTMEDANIILNPYDLSPLTALILFETTTPEEITIEVSGKDDLTTITNTFKSTTKHYIPIYGLYPDTENIITLKAKNKTVTYKITTAPLPDDLIAKTVVNETENLTFINDNNYIYALDKNNDIRWYLNEPYKYNILKIDNGNYLIPTSTVNTNGYPVGLMEIDLLGKVYKQYNIENGYYGSIIETSDSYYILSKNLLKVDKQTGYLFDKIELKDKYNDLTYNKENNTINLLNETNTLSINLTTKEEVLLNEKNIFPSKENNAKLYTGDNNYKITNGVVFDITNKTEESTKDIFLIGYKKIDKFYNSHNIKITKDQDYLKITGDFSGREVYLILDKFMDKRIYDITNNYTIINKTSLSGKYNIYLKIDDTIYKTNQYVEF